MSFILYVFLFLAGVVVVTRVRRYMRLTSDLQESSSLPREDSETEMTDYEYENGRMKIREIERQLPEGSGVEHVPSEVSELSVADYEYQLEKIKFHEVEKELLEISDAGEEGFKQDVIEMIERGEL